MPRRINVDNSPNGEEMRGDCDYVGTSGVDLEAIFERSGNARFIASQSYKPWKTIETVSIQHHNGRPEEHRQLAPDANY